ncbi:MAG TPA: TonB-dependent receptor plug domain-containing protein [Gemmatimonadaceae bacterium]|nr:TonB-dependent receptor plug domain-containing protein [Gemmatimonadaceae bacterium]
MSAGAQSFCAPASRAMEVSVSGNDATGILARTVSLHGRDVSLREALDRLAAAAHIRLSYTAEVLPLTRPVCLDYGAATVAHVLADLLQDAPVQPVILGGDQLVLAPVRERPVTQKGAESVPILQKIGQLDRVVVTGSAAGASQRSLPVALDVVSGKQLSQRGATTLSTAIDGEVPGLWMWEQSPLSLLARYGSIRGASSFGVSYPKVYIDGIEVANSLLVTHLDPESISRIEVIRGPQGAALYGADAISGVMNIVTRQEGTEGGAPRAQLRSQGGEIASDYAANGVLAQSHAVSLGYGSGVRSGRLGMTLTSIGAFIPQAYSQQLTANGGLRFVGSKSVITGTMRFFAQDARTPSSPLLAGLNLSTSPSAQWRESRWRGDKTTIPGYQMPYDTIGQHRIDSLSRLAVIDSSDRQSVRQYTIGATGTFHQNERWTHTAIVGLDGYRLKTASILDGAFPSAIDSALRAATGNAMRASVRASSVAQFGNQDRTAATVTFAAEHSFVRDETRTPGLFSAQAPPTQGESAEVENRTNTGLIAQVNAGFRDRVFVSGGLRVERNTGVTGLGDVATLPMLGVSYVQSFGETTLKLRSAYGKGIRPPQTSSRSGTLLGLKESLYDSGLSPEVQSGVEAGADVFFGHMLSLHATRFDQRASGLIQPVGIQPTYAESDSTPRYRRIAYELQNVGEITNSGWEMQGTFGKGPWSLGATFTQVNSRVSKLATHYTGDLRAGDRMLEVPARTFGINASFAKSRWSSTWNVSRASDWINYDRIALASAFANNSMPLQDFIGWKLRTYWKNYSGVTRVNARAGLFLGRGMTFTVDGENLLDEQRGEPDNITVLPGRTVSAGLRLSF